MKGQKYKKIPTVLFYVWKWTIHNEDVTFTEWIIRTQTI